MTVAWCGSARPLELMCVAELTINTAHTILQLPPRVEVEFCGSGHHYWGATVLDARFCGRLRLNSNLAPREVPLILSHELMHVHQIHTGELRPISHGVLWRGVVYTDVTDLPYEEYRQLPWEVEAYSRQEWLLSEILRVGANKSQSV